MAITIAQQVDLLYKQAFGVTKTDTANNKSPCNESIPSPLLIRGDTQWIQSDQIPSVAAATANIVQAYTGANAVQMSADTTTVPVGGIYPTWLTNLTYWIPQEFGATYNIKIYIDNPGAGNPTVTGTQIFAAGSGGTGEYYYNYQSGVLNFIGGTIPAGLTSGKVLYAVGYRYIGLVGVQNLASNTTIGNLSFNDTTIATTTANSNLILAPNGTGQVTTTASFTGSDFYGNNATFGNITINLELSGNTANFSSFYVDDLIVSNTANLGNVGNITILGGSNGQFLQTDGNGVLNWGTVDTSIISNGTSNVSIPTANGNILISSNGVANVMVISNIGANITGNLNVTQALGGNTANFSGLLTAANINVNAELNGNTANFSGNIIAVNANLGNLVIANFVQTTEILNGNSNIVVGNSGNLLFSAIGTANVIIVSNVGANITGYVSANGNGTFGALHSNSVTAQGGNLILYSEQAGNSYIELKPHGNGTVDVANVRITSLATPNASTDAATKQYVDDVAQGLHVHAPCLAATPDTLANITGGTITYNNGTSGVGANLVTTGAFNLVDTVNVQTVGSRILVKNEANTAHNGIYTWANASTIVRALDFDTPTEMAGGDFTFVQQGNIYNDTGWVCTDPVLVVGTDPVIFLQFSGAGTYQAGQGLTLTGTVFSVNTDGVTTEISGGNVVVKANAQLTTPNIGAATGTSLDLAGNVLANNLNANETITGNIINITSNVLSNNVTVNLELSGNTANFTGNIRSNNLEVNVLLTSNTANFTTVNVNALSVANTANLGNVGNITILGGSNGQFLQTDGNGVLNWGTVDTSIISNGTSNVSIPTANGNILISSNGVANVVVISSTGANITGNLGISLDTTTNSLTVNNNLGGNTANFSGNLTAANLSSNVEINLGNTTITWATLTTTAVTANQVIATFPISGFVGVQFDVRGVDSAGGKYSVATVQAVTNGSNVDYSIFGGVNIGNSTGTLAVLINGSNIELGVTPTSSNSTVWQTQFRLI